MKKLIKIMPVLLALMMATSCAKKHPCAGLAAHPDYKPTWTTR